MPSVNKTIVRCFRCSQQYAFIKAGFPKQGGGGDKLSGLCKYKANCSICSYSQEIYSKEWYWCVQWLTTQPEMPQNGRAFQSSKKTRHKKYRRKARPDYKKVAFLFRSCRILIKAVPLEQSPSVMAHSIHLKLLPLAHLCGAIPL